MTAPKPAYLVKGTDPGLIGRAFSALLGDLTGGRASVHVEEHWPETGAAASDGEGGSGGSGKFNIAPILEACETPAFLFDRRVIVVRRAGVLDAAQARRIAAYLAGPLPTSTLVFVADDKSVPAALDKAVKAAGEIIDVSGPVNAGGRRSFLDAELRRAGVKLDREGRGLIESTLGEDLSTVPGILANLAIAYANGEQEGRKEVAVSAAQLAPFLGDAGAVAPWALTDAIDAGDAAGAIDALDRMSTAGDRHPLAILPSLHRHFGGMLAVDGLTVDENSAARILGMKPYPAGKIVRQGRKLGLERISEAVVLIADADLDLRGRTELPSEAIMEVLVARLARLSREARSGRGTSDRPVRSSR